MNLLAEAERRKIDYAQVKEACLFRIVNAQPCDISIIVPVHGRTEFNHILCDHFLRATYQTPKRIVVTIVEHSAEPQHRDICYDWVNYIWIPLNGDAFNKCLAHNIGALYSNSAEWFLFHDVDTVVPQDYFVKLYKNIKRHSALQTFTQRRLLYCSEHLTQQILNRELTCDNVPAHAAEFKIGQGKAQGGSMLVHKKLFVHVGGFDAEFFTEYSVEDAFFFEKLTDTGSLGFCDYPEIELAHLHHKPSFNRTTKEEDFDTLRAYKNASEETKKDFIVSKFNHFKQYFSERKTLPMRKEKIKIVDKQFPHGLSFGTGDLKIAPTYFDWDRERNGSSDIVVITEASFNQVDTLNELVKIGLVIEPPAINPQVYEQLREPSFYNKFNYILTYNKDLCAISPKFVWYAFGGCWIMDEHKQIHPKTKNVSIIASHKRETEGHQLRHAVIEKFGSRLDGIFGNGYHKVENKIEALKPFRYSVIIENDNNELMFSEKLIDCLVTGTVPIFWGGKTINNYFNPKGMFPFSNFEELDNILAMCDEETYKYMLPAIEDNFNRAMQYTIPEDYIWNNFLKRFY